MANFADLLKKIANNAKLTPQELDELGRFGTETQQRNSLVSGSFQNVETLNVKNIKAVSVEADFVSTLGCRVLRRSTTQTIANASGVLLEFDVEIYDDDSMINLSTSTDAVSINTSGRWLLIGTCAYSDTGSDLRSLQAVIYDSAGSPIGAAVGGVSARFNSILDLVYLEKGWSVKFMVRQDSGSSKTINYSTATFVLMRKTDIGDD